MSEIPIEELTIADFHERLQDGELTAEAVVCEYLDRIERYDQHGSRLNAVLTVNDGAVDRAQELDAELEAGALVGPLHGVPVLVKDQAQTKGLRTTFGSEGFAAYIPDLIRGKKSLGNRPQRSAVAPSLSRITVSSTAVGSGSVLSSGCRLAFRIQL